jgi:hypothetical protein
MKPLILLVAGNVLLAPPHHAPVRASVEVSIFRVRDGFWAGSLRTRRDGGFTVRLLGDERYYFRVRPTRKPFCHSTGAVVEGERGTPVRVRIQVPTAREKKCES